MPGYKTHLRGGFLAFFTALIGLGFFQNNILSIDMLIEWVSFCLLGSLFPDIDIKSKGQKVFYVLLLIVLSFLIVKQRWCAISVLALLGCIPNIVKHRSWFHSWWFIGSLIVFIAYSLGMRYPSLCMIVYYDAYFFLWGFLSHILLDFYAKKRR